jgi:hypothetical protein
MSKSMLRAALALLAVLPVTANAVTLRYEVSALPSVADPYFFSFELDTERAPSFLTSDTIRFAPTPLTYRLPGGVLTTGNASNLGPSFFAPIQQGGISFLRLPDVNQPQVRFFGPALFSGTTAAPTFLTGSFALSTMPRNVPTDVQLFDYRVLVTQVGAVPEPATWMFMIIGFGFAGTASRRRALGMGNKAVAKRI